MTSDIEPRVAVVTGAAAGIGLALVESFVADGAPVVMADIDAPLLGRSLPGSVTPEPRSSTSQSTSGTRRR